MANQFVHTRVQSLSKQLGAVAATSPPSPNHGEDQSKRQQQRRAADRK
jgi:hypothetical protein